MNSCEINELKPLDLVAIRVRYPYQGKIMLFVPPDSAILPSIKLNIVDQLRWFAFLSLDANAVVARDMDGTTIYCFEIKKIVKVKRL